MTVGAAKCIARTWVTVHAPEVAGLWVVMLGGSISGLPDDSEFSVHSDIDLWHLIKGDVDPSLKQKKIYHEGLILETAYFPHRDFTDAESVLGNWCFASCLAAPSVILDQCEELTAIRRYVALHYAEPEWVRRRCEELRFTMLDTIPSLTTAHSLDECCFLYGNLVSLVHQVPIIASAKPRRSAEEGSSSPK